MSVLEQSLSQYRDLRARVDAKFDEIRAAHPKAFACAKGCHSCCKPALTVNPLEREELGRYIEKTAGLAEELRALEAADPFKGKRCSFLGADGACRVYEVRPLVCRSHGAPLQFLPLDAHDKDPRVRDVCPLNFTGEDIGKLPANDVLNLDTLNTLLALLSRRAFPGDVSRTPLSIGSLPLDDRQG